MRRLAAFLGFLCFLVACASGENTVVNDSCIIEQHSTPVPSETVQVYRMIIKSDVLGSKIGPIVDAAFEWTTVTNGKFVFEVEYADFNINTVPNHGEMRVYLGPNSDPTSNVIGTATWWDVDEHGRPTKSQIWIQDNLDPRLHYLTAMHEVGHALGLPHSDSNQSIMYPNITDVGDHPPCVDRQSICKLWGCDPGC